MTLPGTGPELLGCRDLCVGYRAPVLTGVTLAVYGGEAWCVVGDNGSGKTSLLQTLLGLLPPLAGTVSPVAAGDRRLLGYVPQEQRFEPPLPCTVGEFVAIGLPDAVPAAEATRRIDEALASLGVAALLAKDVRALSLGQRCRVAIARAMARLPRLLVLDEPTASLDTTSARQLAADLDRLRRQGLAVVHVSHDFALAAAHATHVAWVGDGQVRLGSPALLHGAHPGGGR